MKINIIILQSLIVMACNSQNDSFDVLSSKRLATYIEARSAKDGLGSGSFGDIKVIDLNSHRIKQITNDRYYDRNPQFISGGVEILFQSNRYDDGLLLVIKGIGGPYDQCIYSLLNDSLRRIIVTHQSERPQYLRNALIDFQSFPQTNSFLFHYAGEARIFKTDSLTQKAVPFIDLEQFGLIWEFKISPNGKLIAFRGQVRKESTEREVIGIFNPINKRYTIIHDKASFESWSIDGSSLLFSVEDTIFVHTIRDSTSKILFISPPDLIIHNCHLINNNEVVFLGREKKLINAMGYEVFADTKSEVYIYDFTNNHLAQITKNDLDKSDLDVYMHK